MGAAAGLGAGLATAGRVAVLTDVFGVVFGVTAVLGAAVDLGVGVALGVGDCAMSNSRPTLANIIP
jgi:serine acetyltransferase